MSQLLQWAGAILILAAYGLSLQGAWPVRSLRYLIFNLLGGAALAVSAVVSHQWGFVLLEGAWTVVAAWGLLARARGSERSA
jgi:hypothetical protein